MKAFGDLEENLSWHEDFFFRIKAGGDLEQIHRELGSLTEELNVRYRSTHQGRENRENELFGYLEGFREDLLEARRRLQGMGWQQSADL